MVCMYLSVIDDDWVTVCTYNRVATGTVWLSLWGGGVEEVWTELRQSRLSLSTDVDRNDGQVSEAHAQFLAII